MSRHVTLIRQDDGTSRTLRGVTLESGTRPTTVARFSVEQGTDPSDHRQDGPRSWRLSYILSETPAAGDAGILGDTVPAGGPDYVEDVRAWILGCTGFVTYVPSVGDIVRDCVVGTVTSDRRADELADRMVLELTQVRVVSARTVDAPTYPAGASRVRGDLRDAAADEEDLGEQPTQSMAAGAADAFLAFVGLGD